MGPSLERRRSDLHLDLHKLFVLPLIPRDSAILDLSVVVVLAVEYDEPAVGEPPASRPLLGAVVLRVRVLVAVRRTETVGKVL